MSQLHSTTTSHKNGKHLSFEERVIIQLRIKDNYFIRAIAREIGCSPTTVSNEIKRGTILMYKNHSPHYRAKAGQAAYESNRRNSCRTYDFIAKSKFINYVSDHFSMIIDHLMLATVELLQIANLSEKKWSAQKHFTTMLMLD